MENRRRLPIGVQSFVKMRSMGFVYVDKTKYIYELAYGGNQYFLSRPRRFGKSLFLSTLKAYWEGKRELFEGLAITELEKGNREAWQPYPVFYFDFNGQNYQSTPLEEVIDHMLAEWEKDYGCEKEGSLSDRFGTLLKTANAKMGKGCVVLVDEYDKPLLEVLENRDLEEQNKAVFKGFFGTLKSYDEYLRFVFITGVTKFSKVSIFSDLNHLQDISLEKKYSSLCGITEEEIKANFLSEIEAMAKEHNLTMEGCMGELAGMYDGYHFSKNSPGVYNPFSLIHALSSQEFGSYWFATGTPTFLVRRIQKVAFDVRRFTDQTLCAVENDLTDFRYENPNPIPLFYQTGYLTIREYDERHRRFILDFPNNEVKYGLLNSLLPAYAPAANPGNGTDIYALDSAVETGNTEGMRDILIALFESIPYTTKDTPFEHYFQSIIFIIFTLLSQYVRCEVHSSKGRADCITETENFVYIFEFKLDKSADEALAQIEEKAYAAPYSADKRQIYKIGVSFDSKSRSLAEWKVSSQ